jgi:hypothetical protein
MRQHASERKREAKPARGGAVKMIVPVLGHGELGPEGADRFWILSRGGEPVAMITPSQKVYALATGDDVVWAFDQNDAEECLSVRYRLVEVKSASA